MNIEKDIAQNNLCTEIDDFLEEEGFVPSFAENKIPFCDSFGKGEKIVRTKGVYQIKIFKNDPHLEFTMAKMDRLTFVVFLCFGVDIHSFEHFVDYFNLTKKYYNI